jgi:hypothetical protein
MASIFSREPGDKKPLDPFARERIASEIDHLKKPKSVRNAREQSQRLGIWVSVLGVLVLLGLYFMDPVVFSWKRGDAIHAYLYLHNFGKEAKAQAIAASGILTTSEIDTLNRRQGSFQDYFPTPAAAADSADSIVAYMKGVADLHARRYDRLDILGKIRYQLFVRWGLDPPTQWDMINPSVNGQPGT